MKTNRIQRWWVAAAVLAVLVLPGFAGSAAASSTYSWTLSCTGNGAGSASWQWLTNGAPVSGASGSVSCVGRWSGGGSRTIPTGANAIEATVYATAGYTTNSKTVTETFSPAAAFQIKVSVSASGSYQICAPFTGNCQTHHAHEGATFTLQA